MPSTQSTVFVPYYSESIHSALDIWFSHLLMDLGTSGVFKPLKNKDSLSSFIDEKLYEFLPCDDQS